MAVQIAALIKGVVEGVGTSVVSGIDSKKRREYEIVLSTIDRKKQEQLQKDVERANSKDAKIRIIQKAAEEAAKNIAEVESRKQKTNQYLIYGGIGLVAVIAVIAVVYSIKKKR
jgi:hypothetical protein